MKLLVTLLVAVVAAVCADDSYYSSSAPQYQTQYSSYSNYYDRPQQPSFFDNLFGGHRQQGLGFGGILGGIKPEYWLVAKIMFIGFALLAGALFFSTSFNSSGRGLDTDEWEINHSVWMDQLQKDFEDSWSTS